MGDLKNEEHAPGDSVTATCAELVRTRLLLADQERANRELETECARLSHELETARARLSHELEAERERANHDEAQLIRAICDLEAERARMRDEFDAKRERDNDDKPQQPTKWTKASPLRSMRAWVPQSAKRRIRRLWGS